MEQVETAVHSVAAALEASQAAIRSVATQLEAEFDRVYCGALGSASASVNPARLAARMTALDAAIPAAADAVLALAHTNLDAARAARTAAIDAKEQVLQLVEDLPELSLTGESGGNRRGDSRHLGREAHNSEVERLEVLCERLKTLVSDSQRAHNALIASQTAPDTLLTNDDIDMELLKAGLGSSSALTSPSQTSFGDEGAKSSDSTATTEPRSEGPTRRLSKSGRGVSVSGKGNSTRQMSTQTPTSKKNEAQSGRPNCKGSSADFTPISKSAYQRLPRTLKQQAKLEELNELYAKVYKLLHINGCAMSDAEIMHASGETSLERLNVLRRGFSVLVRSNNGWSLGSAPTKTAARPKSKHAFEQPNATEIK